MKRYLKVALCITLLLLSGTACSAQNTGDIKAPKASVQTENPLSRAKEYLAAVKDEMRKTVKESYFETTEWHAFVDAYWKGYNEQQKHMITPVYMPISEITY
jgi:hypothetical protein